MTDRDTSRTERARTEPAPTAPTRAEEGRSEPTGAERTTLRDVNHTHPFTGESFGRTQTYSRGRIVAADGGETTDTSRPDEEATDVGATDANSGDDEDGNRPTTDGETLEDVDHEPPKDAEQANRAYQRGNEDAA